MYPLKFKPLYYERIWGGNNLNKLFGRKLPNDKIGESWELCSHKHGMSVVTNGKLAGKNITELISTYKKDFLGKKYREDSVVFPIMIKILDVTDKFSIQVHPSDEYAYRVEHESGKLEAWYIAAARPNAQIVYGLKENVTKEDFIQAITDHKVPDTLRYKAVKTGDMVLMPAGTVHTILGGVVAYEVQQNSDTTYRVYDYDRRDAQGKLRALHIDKALEVIQFGQQEPADFCSQIVECNYFRMEKQTVACEQTVKTNGSFIIFCVIGGEGELVYKDHVLNLAPGETILVPACLESIVLKGKLELLKIQ
jgi:mannose-6-phosphate isomerase